MTSKIVRFVVASLVAMTVFPAAAQEFERILIPSVANEPLAGAFRSQWITEISGRYLGSDRLYFFFPTCPLFECVYQEVPPNTTFASEFPSSAHGAVVQFRPDQAAQMVLSVRARDLSRALDTWGTELPIVRESEVGTTPITLLNLPTSGRFRSLIRLYDFQREPNDFVITVFPLTAETPLVERVVRSTDLRNAFGASQGIQFAALTLDDIGMPSDAPDRVRVTVSTSRPAKFWAFASITNNETQHITIVRPGRAAALP